jgi:Icc-related predicted phosphoesterase
MRLLAISDLHGDLASAWEAVEAAQPDILLSCGDWGDPGELSAEDLRAFSHRLPVHTVFGNHDDLELLRDWRNEDGTEVLLADGVPQQVGALRIGGISGIWAKSNRKPWYITDEQVAEAALALSTAGPAIDVLITHGCPAGVADLTWQNRHGGQRCFLDAFRTVNPRVHLTGHLHRAQEHVTRDGQVIRNVGSTPAGDATLVEFDGPTLRVTPFRFRE